MQQVGRPTRRHRRLPPLITGYCYRRGPSLCSRIHSVFSHCCRRARRGAQPSLPGRLAASVRASTMLNRPLMNRPLLKNKGHIKIWVQLCLRFCSGIAMKSLKATSQPPSNPSQFRVNEIYQVWPNIVPTCIIYVVLVVKLHYLVCIKISN